MMDAKDMMSGNVLSNLLKGFDTNQEVPVLTLLNVTCNSQVLQQGDVFLAIKGIARHGIDYALNANQMKAGIVLYDLGDVYATERLTLLSKQMSIPFLGVKGLNEQYGEIISRFYAEPSKNMTMIGVTGTDGKTSVTHLLTQALVRLNKKVGSIGTLGVGLANELINSGLTTPNADAIQQSLADFNEQSCDIVVMEVSSHALDQYRVVGCEFDVALLTNLGSDHLDYHHNISRYADAKERLFHWESLSKRVLNQDDPFGQALALKFDRSSVLAFSAKAVSAKATSAKSINDQNANQADIALKSIKTIRGGKALTIQIPEADIVIESQLIGDFNINNILAVVSVLIALKYSAADIAKACSELQPIPGRMEQINVTGLKQVIVDFAHTSQALKASLMAAKEQCQGQLWCVFGCGGDRDKSKRAKMGVIAELYADKLIITDDNPRHEDANLIVDDILKGCENEHLHQVMHDRKMAIQYAIEQANEGDTILIAGKGHENFQIVRNQKIPFSDKYVASQCLRGNL